MSERAARLLGLVERAVPVTSAHVAGVPDDGWLGSSPCGEMTVIAAWSTPRIADADYAMPWGETPGSMLLGFTVIEKVVHGWDIARATRQEPGFDDDLAEATLELIREYDDAAIRAPGMFDPEIAVADDAPAIDRLIAFVGRNPT